MNFTEKVACVQAVCEQFDIDEIDFESEDEKIAQAIELIEKFAENKEKSNYFQFELEKHKKQPRILTGLGAAVGGGLGAISGAGLQQHLRRRFGGKTIGAGLGLLGGALSGNVLDKMNDRNYKNEINKRNKPAEEANKIFRKYKIKNNAKRLPDHVIRKIEEKGFYFFWFFFLKKNHYL